MKEKGNNTGIGFMGLLFIALLVLKLCKVITWSWWWITAPLWGTFALILIICLISFIVVYRKYGK